MILTMSDVDDNVFEITAGLQSGSNLDTKEAVWYVYELVKASRNDVFPAVLERAVRDYQKSRPREDASRSRQEYLAISIISAAGIRNPDAEYLSIDDIKSGIRSDYELSELLSPYMNIMPNTRDLRQLIDAIDALKRKLINIDINSYRIRNLAPFTARVSILSHDITRHMI